MAAPSYKVEMLPIRDIFVVGQRRPLDEGAVSFIADSVSRIGLQTPITVRVDQNIPDPETGEIMGAFALVAGRHRLAAYQKLGLDRIPAVVRDCNELDAELWEIVENLHRADLSKDERDRQIRRYAEIISAHKPPQVAAVSDKGGRGLVGIASRVAKETGVSKDTVERALNPARVEAERERRLSVRAAAKPPVIAADPLDDIQSLEKQVARLMTAWNAASAEARQEFMMRIDAPIMDERYGDAA